MSDLLDVMAATEGSSATMTTALCNYGNGSMGGGILRLANETRLIGYEQGACDVAPIAFNSGLLQGRMEGVIGTVIAVGVASLVIWGVRKFTKNDKKTKRNIYCCNALYSSEDGFELSVGEHIEVLEENGEKLLIRKEGNN